MTIEFHAVFNRSYQYDVLLLRKLINKTSSIIRNNSKRSKESNIKLLPSGCFEKLSSKLLKTDFSHC